MHAMLQDAHREVSYGKHCELRMLQDTMHLAFMLPAVTRRSNP